VRGGESGAHSGSHSGKHPNPAAAASPLRRLPRRPWPGPLWPSQCRGEVPGGGLLKSGFASDFYDRFVFPLVK